jgi:ribonuclease D
LGVELPKEHQQSDFSIRPLPSEVRDYIADDVRYLCAIGREVRAECIKADILEEVELDCQRLADEALSRPEIGSDFRVKLRGLGPNDSRRAVGTAIAQALHQLRLKWAEEADVPLGRMLSNAAISALVTKPPENLRELARTRGVRGPFVREHGQEVLSTIRALVAQSGRGELPAEAPERERRDSRWRKREEALRAFRVEKAADRKVMPSVVLSNPLLADLAKNPPASAEDLARVPYFGGKRVRLYAQPIVELLAKLS